MLEEIYYALCPVKIFLHSFYDFKYYEYRRFIAGSTHVSQIIKVEKLHSA